MTTPSTCSKNWPAWSASLSAARCWVPLSMSRCWEACDDQLPTPTPPRHLERRSSNASGYRPFLSAQRLSWARYGVLKMTLEEQLKEIMETMKEHIALAADDAMGKFYTDHLPHVESDTACNVEYRAVEAIESILAGRFERHGDYVHVNGLPVRIAITERQYDNLRKSMLEVMPACPKDAEIASLKAQLNDAYRNRF